MIVRNIALLSVSVLAAAAPVAAAGGGTGSSSRARVHRRRHRRTRLNHTDAVNATTSHVHHTVGAAPTSIPPSRQNHTHAINATTSHVHHAVPVAYAPADRPHHAGVDANATTSYVDAVPAAPPGRPFSHPNHTYADATTSHAHAVSVAAPPRPADPSPSSSSSSSSSSDCLRLVAGVVSGRIASPDAVARAESCCEEDEQTTTTGSPHCVALGCLDFREAFEGVVWAELDGSCDCAGAVAHYEVSGYGYDREAMDRCCVPGEDTTVDAFQECLDARSYLAYPPALCEADPNGEACSCVSEYGRWLDQDCDCGVMLDLYAEDPLWGSEWGPADADASALESCCTRGEVLVGDAQECLYESVFSSHFDHGFDHDFDHDFDHVEHGAAWVTYTPPPLGPVPENCTDVIMENLVFGPGNAGFNETECCANHADHPYCVVLMCFDPLTGVHHRECDCQLILDVFGHPSYPQTDEAEVTRAFLDSCCVPGEDTFEETVECMDGGGGMANPPELCLAAPDSEACTCLDEGGWLDNRCGCGAMLDLYAEDPLWGFSWGVSDLAALEACCVRGEDEATVAEATTCIYEGQDCGIAFGLVFGSDDDGDFFGRGDVEGCCIPGNTTIGEATECLYGGHLGHLGGGGPFLGSDDWDSPFNESLFDKPHSEGFGEDLFEQLGGLLGGDYGGLLFADGAARPSICDEDPDSMPACQCVAESGELDGTCDCGVMLDMYSDPSLELSGIFGELLDFESCCTPGAMTIADAAECLLGGIFGNLFEVGEGVDEEPDNGDDGEPGENGAAGPLGNVLGQQRPSGSTAAAVPASSVTTGPVDNGEEPLSEPMTATGEPSASPMQDPLGNNQEMTPGDPEATGDSIAVPVAESIPDSTTPPTKAPVAAPIPSTSPPSTSVDEDPDILVSNGAVMAARANIAAVAFVFGIVVVQVL